LNPHHKTPLLTFSTINGVNAFNVGYYLSATTSPCGPQPL
jgi:hypothetical protein